VAVPLAGAEEPGEWLGEPLQAVMTASTPQTTAAPALTRTAGILPTANLLLNRRVKAGITR
jgi:hypothetical protein